MYIGFEAQGPLSRAKAWDLGFGFGLLAGQGFSGG